jgi:hypothetical protein
LKEGTVLPVVFANEGNDDVEEAAEGSALALFDADTEAEAVADVTPGKSDEGADDEELVVTL